MAKKKNPSAVTIEMSLSIGLVGKRTDEIEYDAADVPDEPEAREKWLHGVWQEWAWQYIDGGATIKEQQS